MGKAPRKLGGGFAHRGREHVQAALLHDDARGLEATRGMGFKLLLERVAPAVAVEQGGNPSVGMPWEAPSEEILECQESVSVPAR